MSSSSSSSSSSSTSTESSWPNDGTVAYGAEYDVAIIGSGLSGLSVAHRILRTEPSTRIAIFESDEEFGGRVRSHDMNLEDERLGGTANASYGGTMAMLDCRSLLALAQEMDFLPFQPDMQLNFTAVNLQNIALAPFLLLRLWLLGQEISFKIRRPLEEPEWAQLKHLVRLDSISLEDWLSENAKEFGKEIGKHAKQAVRDWFFQIENFPTDCSTLSTFFAADCVYLRLSNIQPTGILSPRILRWDGGTGQLVKRIIESLRDRGCEVFLKHRGVGFEQKKSRVNVTLQTPRIVNGKLCYDKPASTILVRAKRVVIASAPNVAAKLAYLPKLPEVHRKLGSMIQTWDDPAVQVVMTSPTRFWGSRGVFALPKPAPQKKVTGVYGPVFELSERDPRFVDSQPTYGIVRVLVQASRIKKKSGELWSDDKIAESAISYLNQNWFETKKLHPDFAKVKFWNFNFENTPDVKDVTFFFRKSKTCDYARNLRHFRDPHGKIHFAGAERADRGINWMEGAVRCGNLTAAAILKELYPSFNEKLFWDDIKASKETALHDLHRNEDLVGEFTHAFQMVARFFKYTMKHVVQELGLAFDVLTTGFSSSKVSVALESACTGKYQFNCGAQKRVFNAFKEAICEEVMVFAQKQSGQLTLYDRPAKSHCCCLA